MQTTRPTFSLALLSLVSAGGVGAATNEDVRLTSAGSTFNVLQAVSSID